MHGTSSAGMPDSLRHLAQQQTAAGRPGIELAETRPAAVLTSALATFEGELSSQCAHLAEIVGRFTGPLPSGPAPANQVAGARAADMPGVQGQLFRIHELLEYKSTLLRTLDGFV